MEARTLVSALRRPNNDISPDSSFTTRFTPDSDSEDGLELGHGEIGGESFELQSRGKDIEKDGDDGEEGEEEDDHTRRRASVSTVQSYQLYTPDEEKVVVKKFDRKLVLFVALLYMLSFLDRSNIGNAKIAGLDQDLNLDSSRYEWVITAFYIAYICFEWMSVLWKIIPAHIYITAIVLSWGIVASLQSIATSFSTLLILRFLLGIGEAGFTGIPFYLSFFFRRDELALRTGFFISAAPLATSFASTLAWAIIALGQKLPIAPWRLLFLLEGFPSILVAVAAWRIVPDSPSTARYLTPREKKVAVLRLGKHKVSSPSPKTKAKGVAWADIWATVKDPKNYLTAAMFFLTNMAFASLPIFLPTIIHSMGHSPLLSQALSAPPYLLSFISTLLVAYLSDEYSIRYPFVLFSSLISASGYSLILVSSIYGWSPWWRYVGIYPAAMGFFSVVTVVITWNINNQESEGKQGTGFAMLQLIGQCGPLVGVRLYPETDAPLYERGMGTCALAMISVAGLSLVLRWYLGRCNARSEGEGRGEYGELGAGEGEEEGFVAKRGKRRERFVYML